MTPPALDDDPGLLEGVKDFAIEKFVTQAGVKALDEAILPRAAPRDVGCLGANGGDPFLHGLGDELGSIIGTNVLRDATQDEQIGEHVDDIDGFQPPIDSNVQTFMRELIYDVQHSVFPSVMCAVLDEVIGPDMIATLRAQADARSVGEPEPAAFGLLGGNLQPLAPPDPFDPLVIDDPTSSRSQQLCDLAIAVATILTGELDDVGGQPLFVLSPHWNTALRRTMLSEHAADPALRHLKLGSDMINAGAATRGAFNFRRETVNDNQIGPRGAGVSASAPSSASPDPSSARRTPGATYSRSPRSRRSREPRPRLIALAKLTHPPVAAWRRSLPAYDASSA